MRSALLVLLVLVWWPFHHKPSKGVDTPQGFVHFPDSYCSHTDAGYIFLGYDGLIGVSKESCDAAFSDWRENTSTPLPMNQI